MGPRRNLLGVLASEQVRKAGTPTLFLLSKNETALGLGFIFCG